MLGCVIGDIAGSCFEFMPVFFGDPIELLGPTCDFTDDSVLTFACCDVLLRDAPAAETLIDWTGRFPMRGYGDGFAKWCARNDGIEGNSFSNGAVMRVSPAGFLAATENEAAGFAKMLTTPSHNDPSAVNAAVCLAVMLVRLKSKPSTKTIRETLIEFGLPDLTPIDTYRARAIKEPMIAIRADDTLVRACACLLAAKSFEKAITNAIWVGVDADTTAAVVGGLAEAVWGIPEVLAFRAVEIISTHDAGLQGLKLLASAYRQPTVMDWRKTRKLSQYETILPKVAGTKFRRMFDGKLAKLSAEEKAARERLAAAYEFSQLSLFGKARKLLLG